MGRVKTIQDRELLAVAREVFRTVGHSATTRDIANAAGISQAVLYQRFATKDELFFQAMRPEPFDIAALLGSYPPADPRKDLLAIATRLLAHLREFMPTMLKVLAAPGLEHDRLRDWHEQLPFPAVVRALTARFQRMRDDGLVRTTDAHATSLVFIAMVHSVALFEGLAVGDLDRHRGSPLAEMVQVLWSGLAPEAPARPRTSSGAKARKGRERQ